MNDRSCVPIALCTDGTDEASLPYNGAMFRFDEPWGQGRGCARSGYFPRSCVLLPVLLLAFASNGQGDRGSLTEQFPNMSAKERSRIAEREQSEASKDQAYQELMRRADEAFRSARYEEALKGYEEARSVRPYNVYPKVKIEDIRALLAKRAAVDTPANVDTVTTPPPTPPPMPASDPPAEVVRMVPPTTNLPEPAPDPVPGPGAVAPPAQRSSPLAPAAGVIERRYKEGNAHVIERVVTVDGRTVIYKRVFHAWGQVFYFEDGKPVDERVWNARFPK